MSEQPQSLDSDTMDELTSEIADQQSDQHLEKAEQSQQQPLTYDEADHLTKSISWELKAMADNYETVMPLIRQAIDRKAYEALGYTSFGAYAVERFGNSLSRLGIDLRRAVVLELTEDGLSTR